MMLAEIQRWGMKLSITGFALRSAVHTEASLGTSGIFCLAICFAFAPVGAPHEKFNDSRHTNGSSNSSLVSEIEFRCWSNLPAITSVAQDAAF